MLGVNAIAHRYNVVPILTCRSPEDSPESSVTISHNFGYGDIIIFNGYCATNIKSGATDGNLITDVGNSFIKPGSSNDDKRRFTLIPIFIFCRHVIGTRCHRRYIEQGNFKIAKFIGLGVSYFIFLKVNVNAAPGTKAAATNSQDVTGGG